MRHLVLGIALLLIVSGAALMFAWQSGALQQQLFKPTQQTTPVTLIPAPSPQTGTPAEPIESPDTTPEIVVENLEIPWELVFLPDGSMLVTERPGRLVKIDQNRSVIPIEGVRHIGEGGLLGLALHPNFTTNSYIYLYLTTQGASGLTNRVERYTFSETQLSGRTVIIENIPGSQFHDGGRIAFGPDGKLYITTGDAGDEPAAQDTNSLAGKILRLNDDGTVPADNPFGNAVYSYGHRNPQGLAWDINGGLWATEHGRSGLASGFDEVNYIEAGVNYGWPEIQGNETQGNMRPPAAHSGASVTWAPSGAIFSDGSLLFAGLRGQTLYQATLFGTTIENVIPHFVNEFGRLRTVTVGPDGMLYILTNNRDGRGAVQPGDDKIIRIDPAALADN